MNCRKCGDDKDESEFAWKNKAKGIRHTVCKSCKSSYNKGHYQDTKTVWLARTRKNNDRYRDAIRDYIWDYLLSHPCACGEADPIVLEFDHTDGKEFEISRAIHQGYSLKRVQAEVAKCVVRCANCHRRKTAKDFGWWAKQLSRDGGNR